MKERHQSREQFLEGYRVILYEFCGCVYVILSEYDLILNYLTFHDVVLYFVLRYFIPVKIYHILSCYAFDNRP